MDLIVDFLDNFVFPIFVVLESTFNLIISDDFSYFYNIGQYLFKSLTIFIVVYRLWNRYMNGETVKITNIKSELKYKLIIFIAFTILFIFSIKYQTKSKSKSEKIKNKK